AALAMSDRGVPAPWRWPHPRALPQPLCHHRFGDCKPLAEHIRRDHPVGAEMSDGVPQLAPGADQGGLEVIGDGKGPDHPCRAASVLILISDPYLARVP